MKFNSAIFCLMFVAAYLTGCTNFKISNVGDSLSSVISSNTSTGNLQLVSDSSGLTVDSTSSDFEPNGDGVAFDISEDGHYSTIGSYTPLVPELYGNTNFNFYRRDNLTQAVTVISADSSGNPIAGISGYTANASGLAMPTGLSLSAEGRYAVFMSSYSATGMRPAFWASGLNYIYRKDLNTGATTLVNVDQGKTESAIYGNATFNMGLRSISRGGTYVAFGSNQPVVTGFVASGSLIFRKNMQTGAISVVSPGNFNGSMTRSDSNPTLSDDGNQVIFNSSSSIYQMSGVQAILYNFTTGNSTVLSKNNAGFGANANVQKVTLSGDGTIAFFETAATNVLNVPTFGKVQVYAKNLITGGTTLVSSNARNYAGNGTSSLGESSVDGRFVTFFSTSSNIMAGVVTSQTYVKDLLTGGVSILSANSSGSVANSLSTAGAVSRNGQFGTFSSGASNLVNGVTGPAQGYYKLITK
jgi:hypothetical protein